MRAKRHLSSIALACATALCVAWAVAGRAAGEAVNLPNVPLVTQDGKPVRFVDDLVADKVAVINFIFAGCSSASDQATVRLREVQQLLGERAGREIFFYSITVAPESDTPAALKRYAEKFGAGPGWLFLTGSGPDIARLREQLARHVAAPQADGNDGPASLIIADRRTGRWLTTSPSTTPATVAALLDGALQPAGTSLAARR